MGFFKKIFKGVKKVFKKIGKGIKSAFKSVGKFMGKIGIIGQIGLALILPGIGAMLGTGLQGLAGTLAGYTGFGSGVANAAGQFITKAMEIGSRVGNFFSSVTEGVTKVIGETVGAAANSLGVTPESFIGRGLGKVGIDVGSADWSSVWSKTQDAMTSIADAGGNIFTGAQDKAFAALREETLADTFGVTQDSSLLDTESALDRLTAEKLETDAAFQRVAEQFPQAPVATPQVTVTPDTTAVDSLLSDPTLQPKGVVAPDPTLGERITTKAGELYDLGVAKAEKAISDLPARVVQGASTQVMQAVGLEDEPEYSYQQYTIAPPAIDMGSTTSIGEELFTGQPEQFYRAYSGEIQSKPWGAGAAFYNLYPEYMQRLMT
jgi:hypothetical protein